MLTPEDFKPAQRMAIADAIAQQHSLITSDCGFGKTIVGLTVALYVLKHHSKPALIVCTPKGVAGAWSNQYKEWSHTKDLKVAVLNDTNTSKRLRKLKAGADVYIISFGSLKWLLKNGAPEFGTVIADEAECLKGVNSAYRKELEKLTGDCDYRIAMSATPKSRAEDDYWGICKFVDGGKALGETIGPFRDKYMFGISLPTKGKIWKMNKDAGDKVREAIKHLFLDYPLEGKSEVPHTTIPIEVKLTDESQVIYDEMAEKGCIAGTQVRDGEPLTTLEIKNYLAQLSSGFVYKEAIERIDAADLANAADLVKLIKDSRTRTPVDLFNDRTELMRKVYDRIIQKHGNVVVGIWYQFKHELTQLQKLFPDAILDTDDDFESQFNSGKVAVGLLQYQRSSKSRNLQACCYVTVQYSQTFNYVDNYQSVRRFARQGQKQPMVYVYKLHFLGTVDDLKTERYADRHFTHTQMKTLTMKEITNAK